MERGQAQRDHREYEDLLAAAALGSLTAEEHEALQAHMRTCESCRSTFGALVAVADAIPLLVEPRIPSVELRTRLLAQIRSEAMAAQSNVRAFALTPSQSHADQRETASSVDAGRSPVSWAMWGALAAAVLIVAVLSGVVIDRLLLQDDDPETQTIALQFPGAVQSEQGKLEYLPEREMLHFQAPDLPPPPEGNVYQAWLIDASGPRPVGVIDPQTGVVVTTVDREGDDTFAITIEPGPLGSAAPTTDPVIVAQLPGES